MDSEQNKKEGTSDITEDEKTRYVLYGIEDVPSPPMCFLFGLQQAIMCIGATLTLPYLIPTLICAEENYELKSKMMNITLFTCGVATILQTLFGIRLGIVQGGSGLFILPIVTMMATDKWKCPEKDDVLRNTSDDKVNHEEPWESRIREIQGNLIIASITQVVLGCTGIIGILLKFIGPLTIAPTIALIGPTFISVFIRLNDQHWGIAFFAMGLTLLFSAYLAKVKPPFPAWTMQSHCHIVRFPIFQLFSIILSLCVGWLFCFILTATDVFPNNSTDPNYLLRTDAKLDAVERAPWLYWPYPFQFGTPTVSSVGYIGFLVATFVSVLESVCDYHAAARISGVPPPPAHAVNRGIAIEGLSSIVSGMVGSAHGTTSYSHNIGAIGMTKVASRAVFVTAGIILTVSGVVGKFGAVLTIIPDPVVGGVLTVLVGMIMGSGLSALKFVNLDSSRNRTILGTSLIVALMMPELYKTPTLAAKLRTGYAELDQIIRLLLGTSMFIGGFIGCVLDNTVPGTEEERGLLSWRKDTQDDFGSVDPNRSADVYKYPYVTKFLKRVKCCSYIPVSPTFDKEITCSCCNSQKKKEEFANGGYENRVAFENTEIVMNSINKKET